MASAFLSRVLYTQRVTGSSLVPPTTASKTPENPTDPPQTGPCLPDISQIAHYVVQSCIQAPDPDLDCHCEENTMTFQDALVAYRTYAKAEGKSPKTISWVTSSVGYFAEFLGPKQQDIATIKGNDLRRFIIALQDKPKFSNHLYNKPQTAKLSA